MASPMPEGTWTICDSVHPSDKEIICIRDIGHDGPHEALMSVKWSQ